MLVVMSVRNALHYRPYECQSHLGQIVFIVKIFFMILAPVMDFHLVLFHGILTVKTQDAWHTDILMSISKMVDGFLLMLL